MGMNQVYSILREGLKAFFFWHNISKQGVIFFDKRMILRRTHGSAEKEMNMLLSHRILFKGEYIRKLTAVFGEKNREEFAKL